MFVIMLGAPGTGKGTVGKLLSEKLGIVHISSGEIFRSYIKKHDKLGKEIEKYVLEGNLVPDELSIEIVKKRLEEVDAKNGAILDGFPRTEKQAIVLEEFLKARGEKIDIAVELKLSDDEIIDRIVKRRTCINKHCREIYNLEFKPPMNEGICDKCGNRLMQREDDNEETVRNRLTNYHKISDGLINFYKNKDVLYTVKLNNHSEKTSSDVAKEIEEYLK